MISNERLSLGLGLQVGQDLIDYFEAAHCCHGNQSL